MENLIHVQKTFEKVVYNDKKINNENLRIAFLKTVISQIVISPTILFWIVNL